MPRRHATAQRRSARVAQLETECQLMHGVLRKRLDAHAAQLADIASVAESEAAEGHDYAVAESLSRLLREAEEARAEEVALLRGFCHLYEGFFGERLTSAQARFVASSPSQAPS